LAVTFVSLFICQKKEKLKYATTSNSNAKCDIFFSRENKSYFESVPKIAKRESFCRNKNSLPTYLL